MANPTGKNGHEKKPWSDAIRRALAKRELTGSGADLNALAEKLIDKAAEGDMTALKELADRLDGKSVQQIAGADGGPIEATFRWATETK